MSNTDNIKNREDIYIHAQEVNNGTLYIAYTVHQNRITQISGPEFAPATTTIDSRSSTKSTKKGSGVKND